jgi:hypothetical protein
VKILTKNSPYSVEFSEKPKKALEFAMNDEFFNNYKKQVKAYLKSQAKIPIWLIEAACKINEKNKLIPIQYQNLWFCLHGSSLYRKQNSGRIFNSKVTFSPIYVKSNNKILNSLDEVIKECGDREKFASLCGASNESTVRQWTSKRCPIPITALLKITQFTNMNIWNFINSSFVSSKTSKNGIIFSTKRTPELDMIINWIKTDGHISLNGQYIEINQKSDRKEKLEKLKSLFIKVFKIDDNSIRIIDAKYWNGYRLIVDSSVLKWIFCMYYNIPLGYKSGCIQKLVPEKSYGTEENFMIITSFCESEGSFSYSNAHGFISPKFEFKVKDYNLRDEFSCLLSKLNIKHSLSKDKLFNLGIYKMEEFTKLSFGLFPYVYKDEKKKIMNLLGDETLLKRIYLKGEKYSGLLKDTRKIYETNRNFADNINKEFNSDATLFNISEWVNDYCRIPLYAIMFSCNKLSKNYFEFLPNHFSVLLFAQGYLTESEFDNIRKRGINYGL